MFSLAFLYALAPCGMGVLTSPPMGWMSWTQYYCETDCEKHPGECIDEQLYKDVADTLVKDHYSAVGYVHVHVDDCWAMKPGKGVHTRDENDEIISDPVRFPSGMKALGDYIHDRGLKFGLYTDIGPVTCEGYEATLNHEETDAASFAKWGVDYIKVDGCNANETVFNERYKKLGDAMKKVANITYSCSWPAYLGDDENKKPYDRMLEAGCDTWRNWADVSNSFASVTSIINHWAKYNATLSAVRHAWNDPDMLIAGCSHGDVLPISVAKMQLAVWSIINAPLIMSNDIKKVTAEYREVLQNKEMIAVDQFPGPPGGIRKQIDANVSIWAKWVDGDLAVALVNMCDHEVKVPVDWLELFGAQPSAIQDIFAGTTVFRDADPYVVERNGVLFLKAIRAHKGIVVDLGTVASNGHPIPQFGKSKKEDIVEAFI